MGNLNDESHRGLLLTPTTGILESVKIRKMRRKSYITHWLSIHANIKLLGHGNFLECHLKPVTSLNIEPVEPVN